MKNSLINCALSLLLISSSAFSVPAIAQSKISQTTSSKVQQVKAAILKKLASQNYPTPGNIKFYQTEVIGNYGWFQWINGEAGGAATAIKQSSTWEIKIYGGDWGGAERLVQDGIPRATAIKLLGKSLNAAELEPSITFAEGAGLFAALETNVNVVKEGATLKISDYHFARMFEITSYMCDAGMVSPAIDWTYLASSGKTKLGEFKISCALAAQIVQAYKVRSPKPTTIYFSNEENSGITTQDFRVSILDIEHDPNKTKQWAKFVAGFKRSR